jgi:hypothetical protein
MTIKPSTTPSAPVQAPYLPKAKEGGILRFMARVYPEANTVGQHLTNVASALVFPPLVATTVAVQLGAFAGFFKGGAAGLPGGIFTMPWTALGGCLAGAAAGGALGVAHGSFVGAQVAASELKKALEAAKP